MSDTSKDRELMERMRKYRESVSGVAPPDAPTMQTKTIETKMEKNPLFGCSIDSRWNRAPFEVTDWDAVVRDRIPKAMPYHFNKKLVDQLLFAMKVGTTCLLHGPTGTGKTSVLNQLAARLNIPFFRVGCHPQMEAQEWLGSISVISENGVPVTKSQPTDTTLAATYGGILCIDEAFRAPNLMAVQSLLESPPSLVLQDSHGSQRALTPSAPLWIFLTDNTNGTGDTTGRYIAQVQDVSTLDRITSSVYVDYMTPSEEHKTIKELFGEDYNEEIAKSMIATAGLIRSAFLQNKILQTMSIRGLTNWYRNFVLLQDVSQSFILAFGSKLTDTCKAQAYSCFRQVYGKEPG